MANQKPLDAVVWPNRS